MKLEYFTSQKDNLDKQIKQLESATFKISMLRLLVGLSIIVLLLVSYFYKIDLLVYVCFLLLVIFMGLVYYYNKLNQKLRLFYVIYNVLIMIGKSLKKLVVSFLVK